MLEFRILGPLEAIDGDRVLTPGGAIQRALLAILLLNANRVVSADQLIDQLWGEQPPSSGTTALQVRVSQLRKALGDGASLIVTRPPGYLVRIEREQLDLHRFELLVERADHDMGSNDPASASTRLGEALALWRGAPLADFTYEPFAQAAIGRLAELHFAAQEKRIDADLALGRHTDLIAELRPLVREHPLRERLRAQLMLALYRSGRQAEALAEYKAGRRVLVDEIGIEPGTDLQDLERAILRQEPALDLADRLPLRSILVAPSADHGLDPLLAVAESLAGRPRRALVLARAVDERDDLAHVSSLLHRRRDALLARGVSARAAAFTSTARARDLVGIAREQDVDLLLIDAPPALLDDRLVRDVLTSAPCDVAMLAARTQAPT
ncbi:MAG: AfsR/SARP family transcriptional regulator, partial [Actinomycetota bacterium]|nr:AfsR/SARP family transcriptional regulator [Actinomycetota bacterium]